jgi:hypothetical protein
LILVVALPLARQSSIKQLYDQAFVSNTYYHIQVIGTVAKGQDEVEACRITQGPFCFRTDSNEKKPTFQITPLEYAKVNQILIEDIPEQL